MIAYKNGYWTVNGHHNPLLIGKPSTIRVQKALYMGMLVISPWLIFRNYPTMKISNPTNANETPLAVIKLESFEISFTSDSDEKFSSYQSIFE